jgi:hypothetical protein
MQFYIHYLILLAIYTDASQVPIKICKNCKNFLTDKHLPLESSSRRLAFLAQIAKVETNLVTGKGLLFLLRISFMTWQENFIICA